MRRLGRNQTLAVMGVGILVCTLVGLFLTGVVVRAMVLNDSFPFELELAEANPAPIPTDMTELATTVEPGLIQDITPPQEVVTSAASSSFGRLPAGQINIALLGVDDYGEGNFRTDVIMILSLDPSHDTTTLVSFPRDLYITIPGCGEDRINNAWRCGGFQTFQATLENNFGIKPIIMPWST